MLWNVVEGPANSFINLFAAGMLILLWTEAHNTLEYLEGPANFFSNLFAAGMLILLWTETYNSWKGLQCFGMQWKGQPILSLIYLQLEC